ncbi:low molecular weight protein-tyrosine-phosphatase [Subtercola boreus]|uniref:protein-tyrosine-phosphatase n=1 Tax=Subtercola boreus TaxID=120213 RepID=A0A3E0WFZ8_9MICO|nr:low molecular weight protein-tyrosine-phosphatase [Subtercola boreus]RFA23419.1 protein tyrosine phosphatase [Subtercola boreus]RFA23812.1 protein tyrosine phosphatase [Subtercola boreus]RFA29513.1 protein tyrosine phosphatase [Subtercola boreus]
MPADHATPLTDGVFRVCVVCTGNICRSPMAEVVLRDLVHRGGLDDRIAVSSAGTGDWHVGEQADPRTIASLAKHGYDGQAHRARQFDPEWFAELDLVVVLDRSHERVVRDWATNDADRSKVRLLSSFDAENGAPIDVPDPYYSTPAMFDDVLATVERSSRALFHQLEPALRHQGPTATTAPAAP